MAIDAAAGQTGLLQSHDADAIEAVLAEQARCRLHDPLAFLRLTDKLRSYFRGQVTSKLQEVTAHESANIFGHRSDRDTGGATAEQMLARGHHVRALAHRQDDRAKRLQGLGAEVVFGDFLNLDDVRAAL